MLFWFISYLFLPITLVISINIPFINNVALKAGHYSNTSIQLISGTCDHCLCISLLSYSAVNCFSNHTCQLFSTFPLTYRIEKTVGARLYFPQRLFPDTSQCCMPDIDYLLNKLKMGNMTRINVPNPRDAVIDNHGYLVTVEMNTNYFDRFDPRNLTRIDHEPVPSSRQMVITYFEGAYYIAPYYSAMSVIDSENLTVIANISTSINGSRGMIFLNNGQTMVLSSYGDNSLGFLNRTSLIPINYEFVFRQYCNFTGPHGMWRVNDSFFYVTSYTNKILYSFSATENFTKWNETFVFATSGITGSGGASRVTIDECGRFWFAFENNTTLIYDQQGTKLGNWTIPNSSIFDINIADNYLMYFTDTKMNQTMYVDPNIQCSF